ncbi:MAG: hypothetical protein K8R21_05355 [Leptospira sp.]|nr:hypothetical protein [Leptospira sp.]
MNFGEKFRTAIVAIVTGLLISFFVISGIPAENIPGDLGDGRLHTGLLEWQYQSIFSSKPLSVFTYPFFYPERNTLGLSDDNIWSFLPYSFARIFGYGISQSVQFEIFSIVFSGFIICFFSMKKMGFALLPALIVSMIFSAGPQNRMYCAQIPRLLGHFIPLIALFLFRMEELAVRKKSGELTGGHSVVRYANFLILFSFLQLNLSFYYGVLAFFTVLIYFLWRFDFIVGVFAKEESRSLFRTISILFLSVLISIPGFYIKIKSNSLIAGEVSRISLIPGYILLLILFVSASLLFAIGAIAIYRRAEQVSFAFQWMSGPGWLRIIALGSILILAPLLVRAHNLRKENTEFAYAELSFLGGRHAGTIFQKSVSKIIPGSKFEKRLLREETESSAGLPFTTLFALGFSLFGIFRLLRDPEKNKNPVFIFLGYGILFFLFSTGFWTIFGHGIPYFDKIRGPSRFIIVASFFLLLFSLAVISRYKQKKFVLIALLILSVSESFGSSWANTDPGKGVYRNYFSDNGPVIFLPHNFEDEIQNLTLYQWTQALNASGTGIWTPLVNGYSGYTPRRIHELTGFIPGSEKDACSYLKTIADIGIKKLVIQKKFFNRYSLIREAYDKSCIPAGTVQLFIE